MKKEKITLSKYIVFTSAVGLVIFLVSFIGLGFLSAFITWQITKNDSEEDRVAACIATFFVGSLVQLFLFSILLDPGAPV